MKNTLNRIEIKSKYSKMYSPFKEINTSRYVYLYGYQGNSYRKEV